MTRASTVAALAALVCAPALVVFAGGGMTAFGLAVWYLVALVGLGTGLHLLSRLLSHYARDVIDREAKTEPTSGDADS